MFHRHRPSHHCTEPTRSSTRRQRTLYPRIPPEVIELVLDHLDPNDFRDRAVLANFATVSRFFIHRCRQRLFQSFDLRKARAVVYRCWDSGKPSGMLKAGKLPGSFLGTAKPFQRDIIPPPTYERMLLTYIYKFAQLLIYAPHLRPYVRSVRLYFDLPAADTNFRLLTALTSENLPSILALLTEITVFELDFELPLPWLAIHPNLRKQIYSVLRRGRGITHLRLGGINGAPMMLLNMSSRIKDLNLRETLVDFRGPQEWADAGLVNSFYGPNELASTPYFHLESLSVARSGAGISYALQPTIQNLMRMSVSRLKEIELDSGMTQPETVETWRIVVANCRTLQNLVFNQRNITAKACFLHFEQVSVSDGRPAQRVAIPNYMTLAPLRALTDLGITVVYHSLASWHPGAGGGNMTVRSPANAYEQPMLQWVILLNTGCRSLQTLKVKIDCYSLEEGEIFSTCFERPAGVRNSVPAEPLIQSSWKSLDKVLSLTSSYPSLQRVDFTIHVPEDSASSCSGMFTQRGFSQTGPWGMQDARMSSLCEKEVRTLMRGTRRRGVRIGVEVLVE